MGATVKIFIKQARNLPVMDRTSNLTDAYVQVKFGTSFDEKTSVCKKTLNPVFNQTFRFEVTDVTYIQDNVIEFILWDSDIVSSDDIIGTIYIDANLLLMGNNGNSTMAGWLPIYDSFRGICGELYVSIKIHCLEEQNQLGVKFFSNGNQSLVTNSASNSIGALGVDHVSNSNTDCFEISKINMVEELLINDDPERDYWRDMMRSSRSSNMQRQLLLFQLSGKIKRLIGKKVLESGRNTVIGFQEYFDLEKENITIRGIGTQCKLDRQHQLLEDPTTPTMFDRAVSPRKHSISTSPSLNVPRSPQISNSLDSNNSNSLFNKMISAEDVVLCTMNSFCPNDIKYISSIVQCRAVKLLSDLKIAQLGKERDKWWNEVRQEIRDHAHILGCLHVIGYKEKVLMHPKGNICILSAEGTAAILSDNICGRSTNVDSSMAQCPYAVFHIAQSAEHNPFIAKQSILCRYCKKMQIQEVVFSTCEIPCNIPFINQHFVQARICRMKKHKIGEKNAKHLSNMLPFIEYDLHKQMLHKMRIYHVNAIFNVTYDIAVNDLYIIATATGTGVFLECLPESAPLQFTSNRTSFNMHMAQLQLDKLSATYKQRVRLHAPDNDHSEPDRRDNTELLEYNSVGISHPKANEDLNIPSGYVIDIDDETDEDKMLALIDPMLPGEITFSNLRSLPETMQESMSSVQNILMQKRYNMNKLNGIKFNEHQYISAIFNDLYSSVAFKLRQFVKNNNNTHSVSVNGITTDMQFASDGELMITFQAIVMLDSRSSSHSLPLDQQAPVLLPKQVFTTTPRHFTINNNKEARLSSSSSATENELMFAMEDHSLSSQQGIQQESSSIDTISSNQQSQRYTDEDTQWLNNVYVTVTPLDFVPGATIQRVWGKVTQHFIRESENAHSFGAFQQELLMEANAIIRTHTKALGMNCLLNYDVRFHVCDDNTTTRRHAYAVLTVSGDAALITHSPRKQNGFRTILSLFRDRKSVV